VVIWKIENEAGNRLFFAMKGEAGKAKRNGAWTKGPEKVVVKGRHELVDLLNGGAGAPPEEAEDEESEFF
jgi:hypothetical protein